MNIVLIEDDQDDIELLQESFSTYGIKNQMVVLTNGQSAVTYFQNNDTAPDIIILDYNLPKVHGKEVMLEIKSQNVFKNIPLLILTTSSAREDEEYAYQHGADKFLVKPSNIEQIKVTIDTIVALAKEK